MFINKSTPMHFADIQAALKKANITQEQIAAEEQVSPQLVGRVLRGESTSRRIAFAIAAHTGFTTERMWPGRYPPRLSPKQLRQRNLPAKEA